MVARVIVLAAGWWLWGIAPAPLPAAADAGARVDTTDALVITLPDGRRLGYAEYGDPGGWPVFFFHGEESSRLSAAFMDTTAAALGIRLIAPDRPGMGLSDFKPDRTLLDWADDVAALADHLGLARFSVFGQGGGGVHALACARKMPERLQQVAVVSGTSPYVGGVRGGMTLQDRLLYWAASLRIGLPLRALINREYRALRDAREERMGAMRTEWPEPDRLLFRRRPSVPASYVAAAVESFRTGVDGVVHEWKLYTRPWDFRVPDIRPHVTLWYGLDDAQTPPDMGRYLEHFLPSATLHLVDKAAHLSLLYDHLAEILEGLK